jgi:hypothetical protein
MTGYFCIGVISEYVSRVYCRLLFFSCLDVYSILEILMSTFKGQKRDFYYDKIIKTVRVHTVPKVPSKAPRRDKNKLWDGIFKQISSFIY